MNNSYQNAYLPYIKSITSSSFLFLHKIRRLECKFSNMGDRTVKPFSQIMCTSNDHPAVENVEYRMLVYQAIRNRAVYMATEHLFEGFGWKHCTCTFTMHDGKMSHQHGTTSARSCNAGQGYRKGKNQCGLIRYGMKLRKCVPGFAFGGVGPIHSLTAILPTRFLCGSLRTRVWLPRPCFLLENGICDTYASHVKVHHASQERSMWCHVQWAVEERKQWSM